MSRVFWVSVVVALFIASINGDKTAAEDLTKDEIYNINADMYCQTDFVIQEKLLEIENPVNLYTSLLDEDIKDIDCTEVLKEYVLRVHKRLRRDFKTKGANLATLNCFMKEISDLGYDKMRFRFNALYGIEMENEKKDELRKAIDKEIGDTVEKAVDECWSVETNNTKSTDNTTDL